VKYVVEVEGDTFSVEISDDAILVDGEPILAHLAPIAGTPMVEVAVGTARHLVAVQHSGGRGDYTVTTDDHRLVAQATDEHTQRLRDMDASRLHRTGPLRLIAPMPGLIVRVEVQPGDAVEVGRALVVMEAMKMENELRATGAGTVTRVHAQAGVAVEKGTVLLEIE
jgi:biotin carboxyl carrier protein